MKVANRRMIHKNVVGSDAFLDLSFEAMALYLQLTMEGDAYGFIGTPKKVLRTIRVQENVLDELVNAGFVNRFDSGVIQMSHWDIANTRKNDRTERLDFPAEYAQLTKDVNGVYIKMDSMGNNWNPDDSNWNEVESQRSLAEPSVTQRSPAERSEAKHSGGVSGEGARGGGGGLTQGLTPSTEADALEAYLNAIPWIDESALRDIRQFRKSMEDGLIRFAADQACAHGANSYVYMKRILYEYAHMGFRTEKQAKDHENVRIAEG